MLYKLLMYKMLNTFVGKTTGRVFNKKFYLLLLLISSHECYSTVKRISEIKRFHSHPRLIFQNDSSFEQAGRLISKTAGVNDINV